MSIITRTAIRDELLPGLLHLGPVGLIERYSVAFQDWRGIYGTFPAGPNLVAPHVWIPKLTIPQVLVVGAAAAIIRNPEVTRRFWSGWLGKIDG